MSTSSKRPAKNAPTDPSVPLTDEAKFAALEPAAIAAIKRWHHGEPPLSCDGDWELFQASVQNGAWPRIEKFRPGGKRTLAEYAYMSCYHSLRDLQREDAAEIERKRCEGAAAIAAERDGRRKRRIKN
jgi:hypothetical protein